MSHSARVVRNAHGIAPRPARQAVADGLLTPNNLRGPRFLRLFPDIYVRVGRTAPDLHCPSRAA